MASTTEELAGDGALTGQAASTTHAPSSEALGLEALVLDNYARAIRLAGLVSGDVDQAEDAVQAAFERAWHTRASLDAQASIRPSLDGLVAREAAGRNGRRRRTLVDLSPGTEGRGRPGDAPAVRAAFARLAPDQRAMCVLHVELGYPVEEIAAILGRRVGTVRSRLDGAQERLRPLVGDLAPFLSAEAELIAAAATSDVEMLERVKHSVGRARTNRRTVIVASALAVAAGAGLVLAVATDSIHPPWSPPPPRIVGGLACDRDSLPPEREIDISRYERDGGWFHYWVEDGTRLFMQVATPDGAIKTTVRTLTAAGVERIRQTVAGVIDGGGCATVPSDDENDHQVQALVRTPSGVVGLNAGRYARRSLHRPLPAEQALASDLFRGLETPEDIVPPEEWVDSAGRDYAPARWQVGISFYGRDYSLDNGPDPRPLVLPGGSDLLHFGTLLSGTLPIPEDGLLGEDTPYRCGTVDAEQGRQIQAYLDRSGGLRASPAQTNWRFTVPGLNPYDVSVELYPMLPHDQPCDAPTDERPEPMPLPTLPADPGLLHGASACEYLTDKAATEVLHLVVQGRVSDPGINALGLQTCQLQALGGDESSSATIDVRRQRTSGDEAERLAHRLLGDAAPEAFDEGWILYPNGCQAEDRRGDECGPAVVIARDPYFVLVGTESGDGETARQLAHAVVAHVKELGG